MGLVTLEKRPQRNLCEDTRSLSWKRALAGLCWRPDLTPSVSKPGRDTVLLYTSYPLCGVLLQEPEQTKTTCTAIITILEVRYNYPLHSYLESGGRRICKSFTFLQSLLQCASTNLIFPLSNQCPEGTP